MREERCSSTRDERRAELTLRLPPQLSPLPTPTSFQSSLLTTLTTLIRSTFLALPDAFVASPLWSSHHLALEKLLLGVEEPKLRETVLVDLEELRGRQEAAGRGAVACGVVGGEGEGEEDEAEELETIQVCLFASLCWLHKMLTHPSCDTDPRRLDLPPLPPRHPQSPLPPLPSLPSSPSPPLLSHLPPPPPLHLVHHPRSSRSSPPIRRRGVDQARIGRNEEQRGGKEWW